MPEGELPISGVYAARGAIYWRVNDAGVNGVRRLRLQHGARTESLHLPSAANVADVVADAESDATVLSTMPPPAYLAVDAKTGPLPIPNCDRPDAPTTRTTSFTKK